MWASTPRASGSLKRQFGGSFGGGRGGHDGNDALPATHARRSSSNLNWQAQQSQEKLDTIAWFHHHLAEYFSEASDSTRDDSSPFTVRQHQRRAPETPTDRKRKRKRSMSSLVDHIVAHAETLTSKPVGTVVWEKPDSVVPPPELVPEAGSTILQSCGSARSALTEVEGAFSTATGSQENTFLTRPQEPTSCDTSALLDTQHERPAQEVTGSLHRGENREKRRPRQFSVSPVQATNAPSKSLSPMIDSEPQLPLSDGREGILIENAGSEEEQESLRVNITENADNHIALPQVLDSSDATDTPVTPQTPERTPVEATDSTAPMMMNSQRSSSMSTSIRNSDHSAGERASQEQMMTDFWNAHLSLFEKPQRPHEKVRSNVRNKQGVQAYSDEFHSVRPRSERVRYRRMKDDQISQSIASNENSVTGTTLGFEGGGNIAVPVRDFQSPSSEASALETLSKADDSQKADNSSRVRLTDTNHERAWDTAQSKRSGKKKPGLALRRSIRDKLLSAKTRYGDQVINQKLRSRKQMDSSQSDRRTRSRTLPEGQAQHDLHDTPDQNQDVPSLLNPLQQALFYIEKITKQIPFDGSSETRVKKSEAKTGQSEVSRQAKATNSVVSRSSLDVYGTARDPFLTFAASLQRDWVQKTGEPLQVQSPAARSWNTSQIESGKSDVSTRGGSMPTSTSESQLHKSRGNGLEESSHKCKMAASGCSCGIRIVVPEPDRGDGVSPSVRPAQRSKGPIRYRGKKHRPLLKPKKTTRAVRIRPKSRISRRIRDMALRSTREAQTDIVRPKPLSQSDHDNVAAGNAVSPLDQEEAAPHSVSSDEEGTKPSASETRAGNGNGLLRRVMKSIWT